MTGSILISGGGVVATTRPTRPSWAQRAARAGAVARLRGLRSGAVVLRCALGEERLGDPAGRLGTIELCVHDPATWTALAFGGDVGAGEAYVAGQWSCSDLTSLMRLFVADRDVLLGLHDTVWSWPRRLLLRLGQFLRRNDHRGSRANIRDHYDLGDDLFAHFLDPSMTYSSAFYEHAGQSLADAQQAKLRRLCRLVELQPGERLLEIGSGWGSLARCAAGEFGARVTTTTISQNQHAHAQRVLRDAGLGERVAVLQRDYRELDGEYDKLLSCEMIEAVGAAYLPTFLRVCADRLRPGGLLGLQAITIQHRHYPAALRAVDYIRRHVFPGSFIPSVEVIAAAAAKHTDLRLEYVEDFGQHYATTLQQWRERVQQAPEPFLQRGGEALVRAWHYYFAYCEAGFRERHIGVAHLRFRRAGATA
ncbi:MAG: class I SAM-dependent methyltransferase [Planctomycetes bacterium]|nr:class I SAM-dependent methyltransferase [Planctomycetota bacterium]